MAERRVPTDLLIAASISAIAAVLLIPMIALVSTRKASESALVNLHRMSQAMLLYVDGNDDRFPAGDSCLAGSSMNVELDENRRFRSEGCGIRSYDRVNVDHWQKWLEPYFENDEVFLNPLREREPLAWEANGILANGLLLNTSLLGLFPPANELSSQPHPSWKGGTLSGVVNTNAAMLILDLPSYNASLPILTTKASGYAYPLAVREFFVYMVNQGTLSDCMGGHLGRNSDLQKAPMNGLNRVSVSGNAHFLPSQDFLQMTPSRAELGLNADLSRADLNCRALAPNSGPVLTVPSVTIPSGFPLWDMP